jgi:hypothetical protein
MESQISLANDVCIIVSQVCDMEVTYLDNLPGINRQGYLEDEEIRK